MKDRLARIPRWLIALLAGVAAAFAHPPWGLLPGLLGYAVLLWLIDEAATTDRPLRSAFWRGWLAGAAYFGVGTWWVAEAFLVDIAAHGWMAPFAVVLMAGGVALFWGAAALTYRWIGASGLARPLIFAGVLTVFEWLRGHVLTGFPWNLPGETWRAGSAMSQSASLFGAYGLTFVTLAVACAPVLWGRRREGRPGRIAIAVAAGLLGALWAWGALRIADAEPDLSDGLRIRIVQADIKQAAKYDPAHFKRIVDAYVGLTRRPPPPGKAPAHIVIWPEGAIPASANEYLAPGVWTRDAIESALTPGQVLMVGAYRFETADEVYNSLVAVERSATRGLVPIGVYDKHRLVPFGEYMPLDGLATKLGIKALVKVSDGFAAGPPPRPLAIPGLPVFQPLICYEALYPGFTQAGRKASGQTPDFIVNVSNDAWFGSTSGPRQHLNLASYRAIESGVPILRSTPTGVSAVIDALGRTGPGALDLGETGVIDAVVPQQRFETLYNRLGDWPLIVALGFTLGLILRIRVVLPLKRRQNGVKGG